MVEYRRRKLLIPIKNAMATERNATEAKPLVVEDVAEVMPPSDIANSQPVAKKNMDGAHQGGGSKAALAT